MKMKVRGSRCQLKAIRKRVKLCVGMLFLSLAQFLNASSDVPSLQIKEVQPGIFLHQSYKQVQNFGLVSSNGLIVVEGNKAFLIDTPWSQKDTQKLLHWLTERNYLLVGSLSTHSHDDRSAGIQWLNKRGVPTIASQLTNEMLRQEKKAEATQSFINEASIFSDSVKAFYPGKGHSSDNIVAWLPKQKILFGGCLIRSMQSKTLGYTGEASIADWPESVRKVREKYSKIKLVVPGHGALAGPEMLDHTIKLATQKLNSNFN